jgi:hypothetical protein
MVVQEYIERVGRKQDLVLRITGVDSACWICFNLWALKGSCENAILISP